MDNRTPQPGLADGRSGASPRDRHQLDRAMAKLQRALQYQLQAVRDHQAALAVLDDRMTNLDVSCRRYRHALGGIDLDPLRRKSLTLAKIMGDFLERRETADPPPGRPRAA